MRKRISFVYGLVCLLVSVSSVYAAPTYTLIGTATNDTDPSAWQTYQFDVSQYISGSSSASLYFDLRNDSPASLYEPDRTVSDVFFGIDPGALNYFAHLEYVLGADTSHYRNVWLNIDGVKYLDQYGPYNNHLGTDALGTSYSGVMCPAEGYNYEIVGRNIKGEIGTFDTTTYILSRLIEVTTDQSYISDSITLGSELSFDYWWKMGQETEDFNMDILYFSGGKWNSLLGWEINFEGTSPDWQTASFYVPEYLRGVNTQIRFSLLDWGAETDPTLYLRDIKSTGAPVPEPATMLLLGTGLIGLAGMRRRIKK